MSSCRRSPAPCAGAWPPRTGSLPWASWSCCCRPPSGRCWSQPSSAPWVRRAAAQSRSARKRAAQRASMHSRFRGFCCATSGCTGCLVLREDWQRCVPAGRHLARERPEARCPLARCDASLPDCAHPPAPQAAPRSGSTPRCSCRSGCPTSSWGACPVGVGWSWVRGGGWGEGEGWGLLLGRPPRCQQRPCQQRPCQPGCQRWEPGQGLQRPVRMVPCPPAPRRHLVGHPAWPSTCSRGERGLHDRRDGVQRVWG